MANLTTRWPLAGLLATVAALSMSCADKPASQIVLVFTGNLSTGDLTGNKPELDFIEISGTRSGSEILGQISVGRGAGMNAYPASITLFNRDDNVDASTVGTLTISGFTNGTSPPDPPLSFQTLNFSLPNESTRQLKIPLQLECFGVACPINQTCLDGVCGTVPTLDGNSLPPYSEATDPSKHFENCLSVRAKDPCFSGAKQISAVAVLPDINDTKRCTFQISNDDLPAEGDKAFNIAAVWAESGDRYAIIDKLGQPDPATPWRGTDGWSYNRVPGAKGGVEIKLPEGICKHTPVGETGRIKSFIITGATDPKCFTKTPTTEVCDHFPGEANSKDITCTEAAEPSGALSAECNLCLAGNIKNPVIVNDCKNDGYCKQISTCLTLCKALNPSAECNKHCARTDNCIGKPSVDLAQKYASVLQDAIVTCAEACKPKKLRGGSGARQCIPPSSQAKPGTSTSSGEAPPWRAGLDPVGPVSARNPWSPKTISRVRSGRVSAWRTTLWVISSAIRSRRSGSGGPASRSRASTASIFTRSRWPTLTRRGTATLRPREMCTASGSSLGMGRLRASMPWASRSSWVDEVEGSADQSSMVSAQAALPSKARASRSCTRRPRS